jgi:hypothetical protein
MLELGAHYVLMAALARFYDRWAQPANRCEDNKYGGLELQRATANPKPTASDNHVTKFEGLLAALRCVELPPH